MKSIKQCAQQQDLEGSLDLLIRIARASQHLQQPFWIDAHGPKEYLISCVIEGKELLLKFIKFGDIIAGDLKALRSVQQCYLRFVRQKSSLKIGVTEVTLHRSTKPFSVWYILPCIY